MAGSASATVFTILTIRSSSGRNVLTELFLQFCEIEMFIETRRPPALAQRFLGRCIR